MYYAGIGSRETPRDILNKMTRIAKAFEVIGFTLRSGGARGADRAFERGVQNRKEIFYSNDATKEAIDLALKFHPNPNAIKKKPYVLGLMGRNMQIVLGRDLVHPVKFIVCWTKDGGPTGGTGQALRIAQQINLKVYNLYYKQHLIDLVSYYNDFKKNFKYD